MAYEVTKLVHGEEEALKVKQASEEIFKNKGNSKNTETMEIEKSLLDKGLNIIDTLMLSGIFESKLEARRMIKQNGISLNGNKENDVNKKISINDFTDNALVIQKGKKQFIKVIIK